MLILKLILEVECFLFMSISIRLDVLQQRNIFYLVCLGWPRDTSNFLLLASLAMLAKIHHSILQSWPVTTASIAMPKPGRAL